MTKIVHLVWASTMIVTRDYCTCFAAVCLSNSKGVEAKGSPTLCPRFAARKGQHRVLNIMTVADFFCALKFPALRIFSSGSYNTKFGKLQWMHAFDLHPTRTHQRLYDMP